MLRYLAQPGQAALSDVRFWGVKRTSLFQSVMSAFDPKQTSGCTPHP